MAAEKAGVPAVENVCEGFIKEAKEIGQLGGYPWVRVVNYPGHIDTYTLEERNKYIAEKVAPGIIDALTTPIPAEAIAGTSEPSETAVVFKGTWEQVLDFYREKQWSDGLPIVPPTIERVKEFLKYTDHAPDEVITGPLQPSKRKVTTWTVAVNGVMAGCRPEYMPVLVALAQALGDPRFFLQNLASTPGWEPMLILSGPLVKQLGFNYQVAVMTAGPWSNTSCGRFVKLFCRNVTGITVERMTNMGSIGSNWFNVMAENEDSAKAIGWKTLGVQQGFKPEDSVVHVMSAFAVTAPVYPLADGHTGRGTGDDFLDYMDWDLGRRGFNVSRAVWGISTGNWDVVIAICPLIAEGLAKSGYSKEDVAQYMYTHVKEKAGLLEGILGMGPQYNHVPGMYCKLVKEGKLPKEFCESEDPNREVPLFGSPKWIHILVTGDPGRNQVRGYMSNVGQGPFTSKKVDLPKNWDALMKASPLPDLIVKSGQGFY